jgi:hypothetical protein
VDFSTEQDVITTAFYVPATHVNHLRAGMRVQIKATHLPGYANFVWMRCLNVNVKHVSEGPTGQPAYLLTVELASPTAVASEEAPPAEEDLQVLPDLHADVPTSGPVGDNSKDHYGEVVELYDDCVYRFDMTVVHQSTHASGISHNVKTNIAGMGLPEFQFGSVKDGTAIGFLSYTGAKPPGTAANPEEAWIVINYTPYAGTNGRTSSVLCKVYYVSGPDPRFP